MTRLSFLIIFYFFVKCTRALRLCDSIVDYYNPFSENCEFSDDIYLNSTELMRTWDCQVIEHRLTTDDGYLILVTEVYNTVAKNTPIVIAHGVNTNGNSFIYRDQKSLTYNYLKNGYKVFVVNFRGSKYSTTNYKWTTEDLEFWNYSFHELGVYDLKVSLDLVKRQTGQKAILVGYSMGTTASFVYGTTLPEDAKDKLKGIIDLAPVAYLKHRKGMMKYGSPLWNVLQPVFITLWKGRFLPSNYIFNFVCSLSPITMHLCQFIAFPMVGFDIDQLDVHDLSLFYLSDSDTASLKTFVHYTQIIESGVFKQFDYGPIKNMKNYNSLIPPLYNLTKIPVPVALFVGANDYVASLEDAYQIQKELRYPCGLTVPEYPGWNHYDFFTAKDVVKYLINDVLQKTAQIEACECGIK